MILAHQNPWDCRQPQQDSATHEKWDRFQICNLSQKTTVCQFKIVVNPQLDNIPTQSNKPESYLRLNWDRRSGYHSEYLWPWEKSRTDPNDRVPDSLVAVELFSRTAPGQLQALPKWLLHCTTELEVGPDPGTEYSHTQGPSCVH